MPHDNYQKHELPSREQLTALVDESLRGKRITVSWQNSTHELTLLELAGCGQTAVTWKACDQLDRPFALKIVLRGDYRTHSLDAEARRVSRLPHDRFAHISFFGEIETSDAESVFAGFYGIVVDWIEGPTLKAFLESPTTDVTPALFRRLARDLCAALRALAADHLVHNDLHDKNLIVRSQKDALSGDATFEIVIIDTGQLKTEERRALLLEQWQQQIATLEDAQCEPGTLGASHLKRYNRLADYFDRTDQEWVVSHLCDLYNGMRRRLALCSQAEKRFIKSLPASLRQMVDQDPSRRLDDPQQMHLEIERLWNDAASQPGKSMISPFDLPSAELIRSDAELMALFSDKYPKLEVCRSNAPVYLYGPRGCGKSTILRSLSLRAVLETADPAAELAKLPFIGVYISCSQELRSRFWLMKVSDFDALEGHVVRYFTLLLAEGIVETLDRVSQHSGKVNAPIDFRFTPDIAFACAAAIRKRLVLDSAEARYSGTSHFVVLHDQIRRARDELWQKILNRSEPPCRPDAQLIFDLCHDLERQWTYLKSRRIAFLLDDYSNQRIPSALQSKLNQAITFSKQGSPIFKVTSEYYGVDLEGVQEGREVHEVNVGFEYVALNRPNRYQFLQNVIERRFAYLEHPIDLLTVLPLSGIEPTISMAREIKTQKRKFYYHGLDTIGDLCSGDFATGLDIIRRIFDQGKVEWRSPTAIAPSVQSRAIREYARHEFEYIRFHSRDGRRKYEVADRLCWLSKECLLKKEVDKNNAMVPAVKNHIDIAESVISQLEMDYPVHAEFLRELVRRGVLFPLTASRSRKSGGTTQRFMIRRILLAHYTSALGHHVPIRIDDCQRLIHLLTEPGAFAKDEFARTKIEKVGDDVEIDAPRPDAKTQQQLFNEEPND